MSEVERKLVSTPDGQIEVIPQVEEDPLKTKDRQTCNLIFHHQHIGTNVVSAEPRYSNLIQTFDIEPYRRRVKVSEQWSKIDLGHMDKDQVGMIVVESWVGKNLHVAPSDEEKEVHAKQIIRIKLPGGSKLRVIPGGVQMFDVDANAARIQFKCDVGDCYCYLWIFPR